ncbi:integrase arm-type DNA-binding domain-containing protein [Sphingomonas sp.]|uniref:integrase arm-type DNA-binding domain-containing protein n=1 Tax=Sphingomonas sp. TaxID=28214 RepID=UPI0035BC638B
MVWDDGLAGFSLRTRASGRKTWVVKLREHGRQRYVTLGAVADLSAPAARSQARRLLERAALDGLPGTARGRSPEPSPTFAEYLPAFWRDYGGHWKPRTLATNQRYARRELVPVFDDTRLSEITPGDIARSRDDLAERTRV